MKKEDRIRLAIEQYESSEISKEELLEKILHPSKTNDVFEKHKRVIEKFAPELIEAENTIERIRNDPDFARAFNYFQVLATRGKLKERINHENGYKVVLK